MHSIRVALLALVSLLAASAMAEDSAGTPTFLVAVGPRYQGVSLTRDATLGGGVRILGGIDSDGVSFRTELSGNLRAILNRARHSEVDAALSAQVTDFERHLFLDARFAEGTAARLTFMNLRGGPNFGTKRLRFAPYGAFLPSKEGLTDALTLTMGVGLQGSAKPTEWLQLRALVEGGLVHSAGRTRVIPADQDPFGRGADLLLSEGVPFGNWFKADVDVEVRLGEKSPIYLLLKGGGNRIEVSERLKPTESQPQPASTTVSTWEYGASAHVGLGL